MRPIPPVELFDITGAPSFVPSPDLHDWLRATFIDEGARLENEEHVHLRFATLGALWSSVPNSRQGRSVVGQAEVGTPRAMGKWAKARAEQQITEWFGEIPDFILTFSADYVAQASDAEFMALVEHELSHCGQERDEFGAPKFRKSGLPAFCIRGHDVEEFVGVVRRYGATSQALRDMVEAVNKGPSLGLNDIASSCGTCLMRAA